MVKKSTPKNTGKNSVGTKKEGKEQAEVGGKESRPPERISLRKRSPDGVRGLDLTKLNEQQQAFVLELINHRVMNATEAARAVGYAEPSVAAHQLVRHKVIAKIIRDFQRRRAERAFVSAERILEEVDTLALRDVIDLCGPDGKILISDLSAIPERMRRCIDGIKVKAWTDQNGVEHQQVELKLVSKIQALELAMKHRGMLTEKADVEVKTKVNWDQYLGEPSATTNVIEVNPTNMKRLAQQDKTTVFEKYDPKTPTIEEGAERYDLDELIQGEES